MQSEINLLRQRVVKLEGENVKLKQMIEGHTRREAKSVEVKAELKKNKTATANLIAKNAELRDRVTKLEQKQTPNDAMYGSCGARDQSSLIPKISITTSLSKHKSLEDIETNNFLDILLPMSIPLILSKVSISNISDEDNSSEVLLQSNDTDVPESLNSKMHWDQNQNKSQNKTSQHQYTLSRSHKKRRTENIAQVIVDGIQDNNLLDESSIQSFASSNHVIKISATALRQNSSTVLLLDLAQLFNKATDAEYSAIKANQEETLCWINYGNEFIIQYHDIIKNSNGKIGEKKAKAQAGITVPKKLPEILIKNESDIDALIIPLWQKFKMPEEKLEQWRANIAFELWDNKNYWKKERESMSKANFLEHKQNFEAKMGVPTTPHKKELKNKSLALIEYA
ncbi:8776_t:CDS:2 [Gigaspora margarita]|uniref:8776_t:CDS:1 n=1 Tax=Gigaspora margarita TaxID=4874 RepID=A0ABN7ULT4_GIGMA|nr:8776_t:CDS:2 [Gigaspora margarita]